MQGDLERIGDERIHHHYHHYFMGLRMIMQGDLERIGDKRMWPISKYYLTFRFVGLRETHSKNV